MSWNLQFGNVEVEVEEGKIVTLAPCLLSYQQELIWELQSSQSRFKIRSKIQGAYKEEIPKLVVKHLLNLDGTELESYFETWLSLLSIDVDKINNEVWKRLIPREKNQWFGLSLEKKIAIFAGASIISHPFSFLFLSDIHLESNSQTFLFNFLKNIASTHAHQMIILWTYRLQIPNTAMVYFKGFGKNVA